MTRFPVAPDIAPSDVVLARFTGGGVEYDHLQIGIKGSTNTISLHNYFTRQDDYYKIERIEFADGTVWDTATVRALLDAGTALNDTLHGDRWDSVIDGGAGSDTIYGMGGSDTLSGGSENDTLFGGIGDDILSGNTGSDRLFGGVGNDTYRFGRGDGTDTLVESFEGGGDDTLELGAGIAPENVALYRHGGDLVVVLDASPTQIKVASFFTDANNQIEHIRFADGTHWGAADIAARIIAGTPNALTGTAGDDTFVVDNTLDTISEGANQGTDTVQSSVTWTLGDNLENLTLTGVLNINGTGNALPNLIIGNSSNNVLTDVGGNDTLRGGAGDDSYHTNDGTLVQENPGEGTDTLYAEGGGSVTMPDYIENLTYLNNYIYKSTVTGNAENNVIETRFGDTIDGKGGDDTIIFRSGLGSWYSYLPFYEIPGSTAYVDSPGDRVIVANADEGLASRVISSIDRVLDEGIGTLELAKGSAARIGTGNALNNALQGNELANTLYGLEGDDSFYGGAGNDTLIGGRGNDSYYLNPLHTAFFKGNYDYPGYFGSVAPPRNDDILVEAQNEGSDTVYTPYNYTLLDNFENLVLETYRITGTGANLYGLRGTGNALDNTLTGNAGDNILDGSTGADRMIGLSGNDSYAIDNPGDVVVETAGDGTDTVYSTIAYSLGQNVENLVLTGSGPDIGTGNSANNRLDGSQSAAANALIGGAGDDIYVLGAGDVAIELAGEGSDTVISTDHVTLGDTLENLVLSGSTATTGTGNASNNILDGSQDAASNLLIGLAGDDRYVVDNVDVIIEAADGGIDTAVVMGTGYVLADNVENLIIAASAGAANGTGNALNNVLTGNNDDNRLDGGAGADLMRGGWGRDTYVVDNVGDVIEDDSVYGLDTVEASISYVLGGRLENLVLTGSEALSGTGNASNNTLDGSRNAAANLLAGGQGNDEYIVGFGDIVSEGVNEGIDGVHSAGSYTLGENLENLELTGTANVNASGNALDNWLLGNDGDNVLDGAAGVDSLAGGLGNDTYSVDNVGDVVSEGLDAGIDLIESSVTWTLSANVENLTLTGSAAINASGNALDNVLSGNTNNNLLDGGAGNDVYVFARGGGQDTISEASDASAGKKNTLRFAAGISTADVAVVRSGSDLVVRIIGSSDSVMIQNFYLDGSPNNPRNPIQQIEFSDHTVWTIQDLVTLLNHAPTGDLSIVGTASANQVLYANNTLADADGMGALGFQWQSSTDGTTWSAISGATTNSYTLPATLVGKQVRVIASYTDGQGKLESVASSPTAAISAFNHAPTGAVTINGVAALNQVLSVSSTLADADGLGTMSYQWQSSTDGSNWSAISGATASTFTLSGAQLGKQVRVAASYLDGNGTLERQFSGALALSNTAPVFLGNLSSPGVVTTDGGSKTEWGYSVAAQADGKYLVSGTSLVNGYSDFTVLRYNSDGARDTSFDGDGQVTTALSAYTDDSYAVAVQADGRIVVGGFSYQGASDFSVARYNSDGSLDTSFSGDGKVTTDIRTNWDQAYSMALQADGKIVLAGFSSGNSSSNSDFALVRYNTNGSLDTSFDGDGKAVSTAGYYQEYLTSVAIQANGKILAAGWGADADQNNYDFVVQRYNANGSLDTSFSGDGIITIDSGGTDIAHAVLAQADGKVLAFGTDSSGAFLLRYNVNGSPDAGFGANGRAETAVNPMQYGNSIALQADGKILLTGFYNNNLALARYNSNGSLDAGFGNAGLVTTAVSSLFSGGNSIKVLADGKIVVAGGKYTTDWSTTDFILARFNADGTPDTTFGTDGHIADQTVSKGSLLSFVLPTTLFVDPDAGDVLTLAATRADGSPLPSWLSFNAATGSFSGTPTNGDVGSVSLKVTATDLAGASVASNAFTVTVASGGANADPTGSVSVGGTAAQNQMLTASNTLADADGLGVIGYQWQSSIDGSTWNAISGATASTFTLGEAQVGKQVRVAASYTDGHGTLESRASASTAAIANVNDAPTGAVTLTGTAAQNQILTAANTLADADGLGSIGYQWQSSIDGTTWSVITGATSSSFTLTEAQVGKQVRVVASYTDGHGTAESVTSSATAAITNANDAPTGVVTLTGTDAQNQTLTAANTLADSDGLGVIAYQWQSSTDGATWNAIAGATASSFTLGEAQVGKQIRVNASYTDGHGTFESRASASTASIANVNDAPTGSVTLAGTTAQNQTLTATNTLADVDGLGVISYQWQSSTDGTNWTTIGGGATASSFTLGEAQVGKQVRVNASYTDGHGMLESRVSASTASITNVNDAPTGTVTLTGSAAQNQILTAANTLADADGLGVIAYQWQSSIDGSTWSAISGATASTFTLGEAQVGKQVRVAASYTDGHGTAESVTSSATAAIANVNDAPTGAVSVSGTASQNQILTASNTLADADGLGTIAYQWQSSTDGTTWNSIAGATGSSFTLGEAQVGKQIRVNASYTDSHGTLESRASASTAAIANVNDAPTGAVSVSGTASQNQILTASNTLADVDGLGAIAYQWQSSIDGTTWGAISGATANTFTLGEAQVGKQVRVNASYTDGHGMLESLASAATAVIANVNDTPTGAVTLTGPAVQNQILTAANTLADADGLGAIAYQWQSSTDGTNWSTISGATANTFTLSEAHVGQQVRVAASYTDGHGTAESVASAATAAISNANDAPTGVVTLTGTAAQNQTLTAANTLADTDGLGVIGYQWQSSVDGTTWNAIAGATAGSFTLTEAQVGKQVRVAASYIDGHGTAESVTSSATAAIANVNDAPTGTVSVSGTASQNQILTADNTLADADGLGVIAYQWQSSNDGTAWSAITGATASSFTLGEAQVGKQVRVAAFYTDDHGVSESVVSTATAAIANVNDAPTGVVTLSGTASQNQILTAANTLADADGLGAIAYQWQSSADGSTWISIAGATASSFTLSEAQVGQQVRVAASYTDGHGSAESIASAATAAIASANTAPLVATPIADQNLVENASFHYTVAADTFSDVDVGDTLSLSASLASGDALPAWLSFDAASRTFSGAPGIGNLADLALRVRATDAAGATADALFHLAVVAAAPLVTTGGSGSDILTGLSGNDVLDGGAGNDIVIGGAGSDTLTGGSGSDALYGGAGDDTLLMSTDGHWVSGYVAFNAGSPGQAGSGEMVSITGRVTPFDLFDGGSGEDVLRGTSGNDAVFLDDGFSPLPGAMGPRIVGIEAIRAGDGDDVVDLTSQRYTYANVLLDGGNGNDVLWASAGNDAIQGGAGSDKLYGGAGKDLLIGGAGSDILDGASGADLLIGGAGNDSIITGAGADLIAFNQGDGFDTVTVGAGGKTISLGGGITYTDLSLSKSSNDLLLNTGSSEGLNFKNWYSGTANQNIVTLQIVAEAMAGFDAASSDPLLDNKLETFDFKGLVAAFDAARVASTVVSPWAVMHALLDRHLASSDSAALGGDLAYQYGMTGSLAGIGVGAAQQVLGKADFGSQAQDLQPVADLKVGGERLS